MPYNDAQGDSFTIKSPEMRKIESLPQPVAQRVATVDAAVGYIARLSIAYQEKTSTPVVELASEVFNGDSELTEARQNLDGVYEGA